MASTPDQSIGGPAVTPHVTSTEATDHEVPVSPRPVVNLRRAAVIAACLGAVGIVILALMGYPLAGAFFCGGLGLGLFNTALVQHVSRPVVIPTSAGSRYQYWPGSR
jgi:hypothetical protein